MHMRARLEPEQCRDGDRPGEADFRMTVPLANRRLEREWKTVLAMLRIYCRGHHEAALCGDCRELRDYVRARLERCHFGEERPTCAKCPVHCYQRDRRAQIKLVMRHAGPRMLWEHPWLSLWHMLDGWFRATVTVR